MKVCSKCKISKEESEFGRDKYSKDGLSYQCKECRNQYVQKHPQIMFTCDCCGKEKTCGKYNPARKKTISAKTVLLHTI